MAFNEDNKMVVKAKGKEFDDFKKNFAADERGFGYIKVQVHYSILSSSQASLQCPLSDGRRAFQEVQVRILHLGGAQRVRDEEGQDVHGQGPPQGHHPGDLGPRLWV